jgi:phosphoglycolate phosphatase
VRSTVSFGDKGSDVLAARAAGIFATGCTWGTKEKEKLLQAGPDMIIDDPIEIINVVRTRFAM